MALTPYNHEDIMTHTYIQTTVERDFTSVEDLEHWLRSPLGPTDELERIGPKYYIKDQEGTVLFWAEYRSVTVELEDDEEIPF